MLSCRNVNAAEETHLPQLRSLSLSTESVLCLYLCRRRVLLAFKITIQNIAHLRHGKNTLHVSVPANCFVLYRLRDGRRRVARRDGIATYYTSS